MSMTLHVCTLNLDDFALVPGSKNEELLHRIRQENRAYLVAHDDYFRAALHADAYLPLEVAVAQIIDGQIDDSATPRFQYEHAAALIADSLGGELETEILEDINPALLDEADFLIRGKLNSAGLPASSWPALGDILRRGPLLKVPLGDEMRLGTGYLTAAEVSEALRAAEKVSLDDAGDTGELAWPEDALEIIQYYRTWLEEAQNNGLGLFFHG